MSKILQLIKINVKRFVTKKIKFFKMANKMNNNDKFSGLGDRILKVRKSSGLNQLPFAEVFGLSKTTMVNYENGHSLPDAAFLFSLRAKYKINLNWLITGLGDMFENNSTEFDSTEFNIRDKYPDLPADPRIDELIESLQIPVFYYRLIADFLLYKEQFKTFRDEYYESKKEKADGNT